MRQRWTDNTFGGKLIYDDKFLSESEKGGTSISAGRIDLRVSPVARKTRADGR